MREFFKKSLGQNFLIDKNIVKKIVNLVKISEKNVVSLKSEAKQEVNSLSKKLAPEIVKALIP